MKPLHPNRVILATVLAALIGCNANGLAPAAEPATVSPVARQSAPTTSPTTQPLALTPPQLRAVQQMRKDLHYLASDEMEGRGILTEGLNRAADYIAEGFRSSGVKPLPQIDGYFQPFTISVSTSIGKNTSFSMNGQSFEQGTDFVPLGLSGEGSFAGPVAFVGYSIASDQFQYDDFAGVELKGKVALALRYEPMDATGKSRFASDGRSDHATFVSKARAAAERGAVALLVVNPPDSGEPDVLLGLTRSGGSASIPVLHITTATAEKILQVAGADDLKSLKQTIDETGKPHSFIAPDAAVSGQVELARDQREVKNVVGFVPGHGIRSSEFIVVGAHYDHLGRGESGSLSMLNRNQIHNGADDNASGTVAMMHLAKRIARRPLERSVIFIAFTAEERGLLGSSHYVNNPPVPLDKVVAMVNLDMVGRMKNNSVEVGGTGTAAEFDTIVGAIDEATLIRLKPASTTVGGRGGMGPSDHASFAARKVPVLFLWTGNHSDYHRPTDDAEKINYEGMAHIVDATELLLRELTKIPPTQYVDAYDRSMRGGTRVRLGIMPDYSADDGGVKVGTAMANGAAARAGINDGDVIVQIGETAVAGMEDYMTALNKHRPGETVKVAVVRNGERIEMEATFPAARRGR